MFRLIITWTCNYFYSILIKIKCLYLDNGVDWLQLTQNTVIALPTRISVDCVISNYLVIFRVKCWLEELQKTSPRKAFRDTVKYSRILYFSEQIWGLRERESQSGDYKPDQSYIGLFKFKLTSYIATLAYVLLCYILARSSDKDHLRNNF